MHLFNELSRDNWVGLLHVFAREKATEEIAQAWFNGGA
jgi:hypothetical protein